MKKKNVLFLEIKLLHDEQIYLIACPQPNKNNWLYKTKRMDPTIRKANTRSRTDEGITVSLSTLLSRLSTDAFDSRRNLK